MGGIILTAPLITTNGLLVCRTSYVLTLYLDLELIYVQQKKSYPLPINILSKDFERVVHETPCILGTEDASKALSSSDSRKSLEAEWK